MPGIDEVDEALDRRLREAFAAKGPEYEPRTRHLEADGSPTYVNRLILESSPYLLQHAHNPVNWSAWSDEAFARAQAGDKPILLSVGYSTCHWCHVMEHESFEDPLIAAYINAHFVPIKVDREERPDIDTIYMTAVQILTGRGGWPMTVALTPQGEPFFGGTYFPPHAGTRGARTGFDEILRDLVTQYRQAPAEVVARAQQLSQRIQAISAPQRPGDVPGAAAITRTARALAGSYDARDGGFGRAPKFPQPSRLGLLLRVQRRTGDAEMLAMVTHTLHTMAAGGMYDHVGGGFHRYSTDARWLVPHFEKMLYDNAQLAVAYVEGYQATGEEDFARVVRETLDYVAREMTAPGGGFYSATDADSMTPSGHREEGWYFTWTPEELGDALDEGHLADLLAYYPVTPEGNFEGRTILHTPRAISDVAHERGTSAEALRASVDESRSILREVRDRRPRPLRDDKVLTAWNGLMISGFARAGFALDAPRYVEAARRAAGFVLENLRDEEGRLIRSFIGGVASHRAYLEDYAFFIAGLLDLYEADGDVRWIEEAIALQRMQDAHFADDGGYFMTADDAPELLVRDKTGSDGAVPSGNSVALDNLLRLAAWTGEERYRVGAEGVLRAFANGMVRQGPGFPRMLQGLDRYLDTQREIVVVGDGRLVDALRRRFIPNRVLSVVSPSEVQSAAETIALLEGKAALGGEATAYVCERGRCELPTSDPSELLRLLEPVLAYPP